MTDRAETIALADLPDHTPARISSMSGGQGAYRQILDHGLRMGSVVLRRPADDATHGPIEISAHGKDISLGRGLAEKIQVDIREEAVQTTLYDLISGDTAVILRVGGAGKNSIRQRLLDMGITRGTDVYVRRHAPLGDPVEVVVKSYSLALRMSEAKDIEVILHSTAENA